MEKLDFIIDIQAFHGKEGHYIPKEVAVLGLECNYMAHWIVKAPCNSSAFPKGVLATNSFLTCYHHGIEWFDGESDLENVCEALRSLARSALRIYVRGNAKQTFLERVLSREIINLEEYGCPSFKNLPRINEQYCLYHGNKKDYLTCSIGYVHKLRYWIVKNLYGNTRGRGTDVVDLKEVNTEELCKKFEQVNVPLATPPKVNSPSTKSVKPVKPLRRHTVALEEDIYTPVRDGLASDSTSPYGYTCPDSGGVSSGSDPTPSGEALCDCL